MDFPCRRLLHTHQRQASGLAPRIEFEPAFLQDALFLSAITQTDHEGLDPVDYSSASCEQQACAFGRTGHERLFLFVEHKNHKTVSFPLRGHLRGCLTCGSAASLPHLSSPMVTRLNRLRALP